MHEYHTLRVMLLQELQRNLNICADTVNSFCFHPSLPLAASASGHRRFVVDTEPDSDDQGYTVLLKGANSQFLSSLLIPAL